MSVKYKLYQDNRENSKNRGKWYARTVMTDTVNLKQMSERIQRNCSMKASDVNAVLIELVEVIKDELQASKRVVIDGFGSFRIGLRTTAADKAKDFSVAKNIKGAKVNFLPSEEVNSADGKRVKSLLAGLKISEYGVYDVKKEGNSNEGADDTNP